jgi:hypothetical protein
MFVGNEALQTTKVIELTHAVSKATYLPIEGSRYLQNGKIIENPSSTRFGARCPYDYPEKQAALCYKPCEKRSDWAFVRPVGPVCWGCPSSHPSEEASLCYRNCPKDKPHKSTFNCFGDCPSGYRNDGLTCFRDAHITSSDNSGCPWYDKCGLTLRKGCSKCPSGYKNDGCTCRRDPHAISRPKYNRGVGVVLRSYGRGAGKAILLLPKYEAPYDTPACSIGNWQATSFVNSDTEVLKFVNDKQRVIVFGFRGTEATSLGDWFKNVDFQPSSTTVAGTTFKLHKGFKDRYNNIASWFEEQYQEAISTGYKIILTGHSLGGAEAVIAAVYAAGKLNHAPDAVVTYGAPLTGNKAFVDYYKSVVGCDRTLRFTAKGDIIPGIPEAFGYNHVCPATEVDGGGDFLQAHDLHVGYQKGLAAKYGNTNSIKAGCDTPL